MNKSRVLLQVYKYRSNAAGRKDNRGIQKKMEAIIKDNEAGTGDILHHALKKKKKKKITACE
jgi:hypothetical protein